MKGGVDLPLQVIAPNYRALASSTGYAVALQTTVEGSDSKVSIVRLGSRPKVGLLSAHLHPSASQRPPAADAVLLQALQAACFGGDVVITHLQSIWQIDCCSRRPSAPAAACSSAYRLARTSCSNPEPGSPVAAHCTLAIARRARPHQQRSAKLIASVFLPRRCSTRCDFPALQGAALRTSSRPAAPLPSPSSAQPAAPQASCW